MKQWRNYYYYILLIIAVVLFAVGLSSYLHQPTQTFHFFGIQIAPTGETTMQTQVYVDGQYKTSGAGFYVGKKVNVSALLYLGDKQLFDSFKNMMQVANFVAIENTESAEDTDRDISGAIQAGDINKAFTNVGTVNMTKFYEAKQTIVLEGDVVFTNTGNITFGMPLKPILDNYHIEIQGPAVEPASTGDQVDLNRRVLLLTYMTLAFGFFALFITIYRENRQQRGLHTGKADRVQEPSKHAKSK